MMKIVKTVSELRDAISSYPLNWGWEVERIPMSEDVLLLKRRGRIVARLRVANDPQLKRFVDYFIYPIGLRGFYEALNEYLGYTD
ncbi:hypothetical protein [Hydrogenivirga sp. 128-5-R1-1]|uniref:hypothetical protein n=1 Tax=Hydrogenivirga sp. 128-5-R1-1 TaxID=392423 RepID=UPI00015F338B|nr:hypothetical protein [Hydrogenivirga sp. 128-5-R1-1]EDP74806.1 hypothetical protein HG1285_13097 [Hydrogenivirga sp. 128-5-R1-1]